MEKYILLRKIINKIKGEKVDNFLLLGMASAPQGQEPNAFMSFLPMIAVIAIVYFLMIRPQTKKAKQQREMISALKKGDKVVTVGGVYGTISSVKDHTFLVQIAANTDIEIDKTSVSAVITKPGEIEEKK